MTVKGSGGAVVVEFIPVLALIIAGVLVLVFR